MEPDVPPPPLTCPRCGLVDQVQKVSAVVTAGVSTGSGSGAGYMVGSFGSSGSSATAFGRMYQESSQQTLLSERLAPLPEPRLASAWTWQIALLIVVMALCACGSFGLIAAVNDTPVAYLPLLAFAICWVGVALWRRTVDHRLKAAWQEEHAQWEAALGRLFELYYCWRDDVVFVPGSLSAIPANEMWDFLQNDQ